ncbi:restriction endonuclease [Flavobacterium sp. MAH-1]|uniref:Restriction endonuclease n=1 Tax=Flavobacterium agri TaxID=2743471 RepID=A0A7Y8Y3G0_9FLAO|nr:restriction endonuclease [Flavobacterium agri]NUY81895.1 restriction endonuclease [Flavobacterium agri]NYA71919.1 restriction endonuclease [Flavobacterium agri]
MSADSDLDWKKYEAITKYIYEALGKNSGVTVEGWGSKCKVRGKSNTTYQIDVLTSHLQQEHAYQTAIECKFWNKKVTREVVMKLSATLEDTGIEKGIIVSRIGFTKDGYEYAKAKNIGLVVLREAGEADFIDKERTMPIAELGIKQFVQISGPEILTFLIDGVEQKNWDNSIFFRLVVKLPDGSQVPLLRYADSFRKEILGIKADVPITKDFEFPGAQLTDTWGKASIAINRITFSGMYTERKTTKHMTFSIVDKVWLVMKDLFEGRVFRFSENGGMIEDE